MPLSADSAAIAETYARIREEVGPTVTVVAATKYVSVDELALLAEAGVEVVGENRLQDLAAKHERYGETRFAGTSSATSSHARRATSPTSVSSATRSRASRRRGAWPSRRSSR